ncbi:hypothetical protein TcWFU_003354 [Taenia crassiceps]|uniref:Fibronectin type-III domain-containing protein n=1 Tax=Taenia crassiceps TaxID=6207 RepID=A0ABR4Q1B4_9CEST
MLACLVMNSGLCHYAVLDPTAVGNMSICASIKLGGPRDERNIRRENTVLQSVALINTAQKNAKGMRRPTFEATYYENLSYMLLLIDDPEGVEGEFGGFEILIKPGGLTSQSQWQSMHNLTREERKYKLVERRLAATCAVTVRGLVLPDTYSKMAEPVEYRRMNPVLRAPRNVQLNPIGTCTVRMSWDPPEQPYGRIVDYSILWTLDGQRQEPIIRSSGRSYDFSRLKPKQSLSVFISARSQPSLSSRFHYVSSHSKPVTVITPRCKEDGEGVTDTTSSGTTQKPVSVTTGGSASIPFSATALFSSLIVALLLIELVACVIFVSNSQMTNTTVDIVSRFVFSTK